MAYQGSDFPNRGDTASLARAFLQRQREGRAASSYVVVRSSFGPNRQSTHLHTAPGEAGKAPVAVKLWIASRSLSSSRASRGPPAKRGPDVSGSDIVAHT